MKYAYKIEPVFKDQEQKDINAWRINFAGDDVTRAGIVTDSVDELVMRCFKHMVHGRAGARRVVPLNPNEDGFDKHIEIDSKLEFRIRLSNWFATCSHPMSFANIAKEYNDITGGTCREFDVSDLFVPFKELNLEFAQRVVDAFAVPFSFKDGAIMFDHDELQAVEQRIASARAYGEKLLSNIQA